MDRQTIGIGRVFDEGGALNPDLPDQQVRLPGTDTNRLQPFAAARAARVTLRQRSSLGVEQFHHQIDVRDALNTRRQDPRAVPRGDPEVVEVGLATRKPCTNPSLHGSIQGQQRRFSSRVVRLSLGR